MSLAAAWALLLLLYGIYAERYIYSAMLFVALALLIAIVRRPHPYPSRAAFVLCSALGGAYVVELVLAFGMPFRAGIYAWADGRPYDFRTYHKVIRDLRRQSVDVYPSLFARAAFDRPAIFGDLLPLGGISNTTTVYCNEGGDYLIYHGDEHGFHNPPGLWERQIDVAILGDSFAQGASVDSDKNFPALIRRRHPHTLNLGMGGNGPLVELAGVQEYLAELRPKLILWCFYEGNDLANLSDEVSNKILNSYLTDESFRQGLRGRQPEIDSAFRSLADGAYDLDRDTPAVLDSVVHRLDLRVTLLRAARMSHLRGLVNRDLDDPLGYSVSHSQEQLEILGRVLRRANALARTWNGRLLFSILPGWDLVVARSERRLEVASEAAEAASQAGIEVIDLTKAFRQQPDPSSCFYYPGSHYNERGHALVAETLLNRLDNRTAQ